MAEQGEISGYLTIYSHDRQHVYGEFADGVMRTEEGDGFTNYLFSGTAGEGTLDTFRKINDDLIEHVAFDFDAGTRHSGMARLLVLEHEDAPASATVTIEWINPPQG